MRAYAEAYLSDVVENQGKLFDYVAQTFPDKDTEDFMALFPLTSVVKIFPSNLEKYEFDFIDPENAPYSLYTQAEWNRDTIKIHLKPATIQEVKIA